jgi:hypothetical protein
MATKKELVSDIKLRLSRGKPSDDFEVDDRQVGFWLDSIRAKLVRDKAVYDRGIDLSDFCELFEAVNISKVEKVADDGCDSVFYKSKLPVSVMALPNEGGIISIETQGGTEIRRINISDRLRFKGLKFASPSKEKPTFHRVNDEIYYEGGTDSWLNNGVVNMYLISEETTTEGDYPISSELIPILLDGAEEIGRRMLFNIPENIEDTENDGKQ